jgi:hypothetical protein
LVEGAQACGLGPRQGALQSGSCRLQRRDHLAARETLLGDNLHAGAMEAD